MYMNLLKTDRLAMAYYLFFMAFYLDENNGVKDIRTIFGQFMLFFLMYVGTMSAYLLFSSLMCSKKFAAMVLLLKQKSISTCSCSQQSLVQIYRSVPRHNAPMRRKLQNAASYAHFCQLKPAI